MIKNRPLISVQYREDHFPNRALFVKYLSNGLPFVNKIMGRQAGSSARGHGGEECIKSAGHHFYC